MLKLDGREERDTLEIKRGELSEKTVEFGSGRIKVTSQPPGAEIELDGKPAGRAPLDLSVPEGPHQAHCAAAPLAGRATLPSPAAMRWPTRRSNSSAAA